MSFFLCANTCFLLHRVINRSDCLAQLNFIFILSSVSSVSPIRIKMSEKLCLKWNDFKDNVLTAFGNLREDKDFADVTLACDDGNQVAAHKVILAASSPFFENILKRNKHSNLVILMRGMKSDDLLAIMDFLYLGEVKIYQENLESFLAVADELRLKGLMGPKNEHGGSDLDAQGQVDDKLMQNKPFTNASPNRENPVYKHEQNATSSEYSQEIVAYGHEVKNVALKSNFNGDLQELDEKVVSMMERTENKNVHGQPIYQCTLCGKNGKNGQLKNHIEANHLEGVSIPCHLCQIKFRSRRALTTHIYENHRNI